MNKKQIITAFLAVVAIALIIVFTPRYKIIWLDTENFIKTEQTSSLYKRSKGKESLYWNKIALYSGPAIIAAGILIFALRSKRG